MNIFITFEHSYVAASILMTFCKRLGHNVYSADTTWCHEIPRIFTIESWNPIFHEDYIGYSSEHTGTGEWRAISFEEFTDMNFDVYFLTLPFHQDKMLELKHKYHSNAIIIGHCAGSGTQIYDKEEIQDVLVCDKFSLEPMSDRNCMFYYPEFNTEQYKFRSTNYNDIISSFVNIPESHTSFLNTIPELEKICNLRFFGHAARDGFLESFDNSIPDKMHESSIVLHNKHYEGYGFVIINALSMGRPIIYNRKYLAKHTCEDYLIEDKSALLVDFDDNIRSTIQTIQTYLNNEEKVLYMQEKTHEIFKQFFDFKHEAEKVKGFLEEVVQ